jgi:DNA mismatch repair ATPase MutS
VSDPSLKGIVKRDVVRIVTPATLSLEGDEYSA